MHVLSQKALNLFRTSQINRLKGAFSAQRNTRPTNIINPNLCRTTPVLNSCYVVADDQYRPGPRQARPECLQKLRPNRHEPWSMHMVRSSP